MPDFESMAHEITCISERFKASSGEAREGEMGRGNTKQLNGPETNGN